MPKLSGTACMILVKASKLIGGLERYSWCFQIYGQDALSIMGTDEMLS